MCRLGDCQRVETTGTAEEVVLQGKQYLFGCSFVLRRCSVLLYVTATLMGYAINSVYMPWTCQKEGRGLTGLGKRVGCERVEAKLR